MVANHPAQFQPKGTLFPGIKAAAQEFGVSRVTLYRVLKGQYPDKRGLVSSYEKWLKKRLAKQAAAARAQAARSPVSPIHQSGKSPMA